MSGCHTELAPCQPCRQCKLPHAPHAAVHSKLWAEPNDIANLAKHIEPRCRARVLRCSDFVYDQGIEGRNQDRVFKLCG